MTAALLGSLKCGGYPAGPPPNACADKCRGAISGWLILQGTADPLISMQSPRFLTVIPHAQFRWLYGLSHVPVSDEPELITRLMLDFLHTTAEERSLRESLPA